MNVAWRVDTNPFIEHTSSVEDLPWNSMEVHVFDSCSMGRSITNLGIAGKDNVLVCRSTEENLNNVQFPLEDLDSRVAKFDRFDHTICIASTLDLCWK